MRFDLPGDDLDSLTEFLQGVMADQDSRQRLRVILRQPPFHRRSLLNTAIQQMQLQRESADVIRALAQLKNDETASRALTVLEGQGAF